MVNVRCRYKRQKKGGEQMEKWKVKAIRINLGMTVKEMAEYLGITERVYSEIENGTGRRLTFAEVIKIGDLANIDQLRQIDA